MIKKMAMAFALLYLINTFIFNAEGGIKNFEFPLPTTAEILNSAKSLTSLVGSGNESDLQKPEATNTATIVRVVDGDTVLVNTGGEEVKVRLIGVNTPETVDPNSPVEAYGKEASDFTKARLTEGLSVELEYDVQQLDQYGRHLAYLWVDGEMFNATLVREGYAQVATYPPNVRYQEVFINEEANAREENKGLWQL